MPRIAGGDGSSRAQTDGQTGNLPKGAGQVSDTRARTLAIIKARECLKLDMADRPADCPPNEELLALLAAERAAKYRPENAEGFSRNELAWRGIPPPCLDDGEKTAIKGGKLCVRVGTIPSKVRTWKEICELRGLGGCTRADQDAVNRAANLVKAGQ